MKIGLFPLNIVVFPGEDLNLHIFEPRYRDLVGDCLQEREDFVIPSYVLNKIEYGTRVSISKVEKTYEDGRFDIKTRGKEVVFVNQFNNPEPGKKYAMGEVIPLENQNEVDPETHQHFLRIVTEFYSAINLNATVSIPDQTTSFDVAHKVGLSLEQKYELIRIEEEELRERFLIIHLEKAIPMMREIERTKRLIKMNGHFKHFDPLNF